MARHYYGLRDIQNDEPVANCTRCRGEVYRFSEVASLDEGLVHVECMSASEIEDFHTHPAACFFEEAC